MYRFTERQSKMSSSTVSVGVLSTSSSKTGATIRRAIQQLGHRAVQLNISELRVDTRNGRAQVDADVDVVLNWRTLSRRGYSMEYLGVMRAIEETVPVVNPTDGLLLAGHKPAGLARLSSTDHISVPNTYYSLDYNTLREEAARWPEVVQKPPFGGGGGDVRKVPDSDDLSVLSGPQMGLIQSYIDTGEETHNDIRAFVVDGTVVAAMRRRAPDDDWRTNISNGGDGTAVDLPQDATQTAERATDALNLDVAGVDLIQDAEGNWYVLEVNAPAGFAGLHDATGHNVAPHIAALAIERGGVPVPDEDVTQLAESLDMVSPSDAQDTLLFSYETGDTCGLAGKEGAVDSVVGLHEEFGDYTIDSDLAADIGAGPIADTQDSPLPDADGTCPRAWVRLQVENHSFRAKVCICDLSEYDHDFIVHEKYVTVTPTPRASGEGSERAE